MRKALVVLRVKDALEAVVPAFRNAGMISGALALLCLNTAAFKTIAAIALAAMLAFVAAKAAVVAMSALIKSLGFSEPGLERMALA